MTIRDRRVWKGEVLRTVSHTLTCRFEGQVQDFDCHITRVYAPNCDNVRSEAWEEISVVRDLMEGAWAICGDFS